MKKKYQHPAVEVCELEPQCAFLAGSTIQPVVQVNSWQSTEEELDFDFDDEEEDMWTTSSKKHLYNAFED